MKVDVFFQAELYGTFAEGADGTLEISGEKPQVLQRLERDIRDKRVPVRRFLESLPERLHGRWTAVISE